MLQAIAYQIYATQVFVKDYIDEYIPHIINQRTGDLFAEDYSCQGIGRRRESI